MSVHGWLTRWGLISEPVSNWSGPLYERPFAIRPLSRMVKFLRRHTMVADGLVAAFVCLLGGGGLLIYGFAQALMWNLLLCIPLLWRRRYSTLVMGFICLVGFVEIAIDHDTIATMAALVAIYSSAAYNRRIIDSIVGAVVVTGMNWCTLATTTSNSVQLVVFTGLAGAIAVLLGAQVKSRRAYVIDLAERAAAIEREQQQAARLATIEERTRIAREMHDIVGHSLTVAIALSDGAAMVFDRQPERAKAAIEQTAQVGRDALAQVRRTVGLLRDSDEDGLLPTPGIGDLTDLIDETRRSGLPVVLRTSGPLDRIGPGAGLLVYRVVQEALTNVRKHALGATRAEVSVRLAGTVVTVEVTDNGQINQAGPAKQSGAGHGLLGMSERVEAFGGTMTAGPLAAGGWKVAVVFEPGEALREGL